MPDINHTQTVIPTTPQTFIEVITLDKKEKFREELQKFINDPGITVITCDYSTSAFVLLQQEPSVFPGGQLGGQQQVQQVVKNLYTAVISYKKVTGNGMEQNNK